MYLLPLSTKYVLGLFSSRLSSSLLYSTLLFSSPKIMFLIAVSWHCQPSSWLLSVHPSIYLSIHPSIRSTIHLFIDSSIYPSIYWSIHTPSIHPSISIEWLGLRGHDWVALLMTRCMVSLASCLLSSLLPIHYNIHSSLYHIYALFPSYLVMSTAGNYSEGRSTKHAKWRLIINSSKHLNAIHGIHTADITAS